MNPQASAAVAHVRARPLLGTIVEIAATGIDSTQVHAAIDRAFSAVAQVHSLMSYQEASSEVSRINREGFARAVAVHAHTWQVLKVAQEISAASDGLFDISIAPALTRLGFLPHQHGFGRASRHANWRHVQLLPGQQVRLARRLRIDLSGIAKGYAVDLAIRALQAAGMHAGRVNAGGDLRVFGASTQTIHVRLPHAPTQTVPLLALQQGAAATSAGYFAQRRRAGHKVTSLIHPHTRQACGVARSVTILAQACIYADALTKVVHADPAQAASLAVRFHARALIIEPDPTQDVCRLFDSARAAPSKQVAAHA